MTNQTALPDKGFRAALWLALLVSAAANFTTSALGFSPFISVPLGLIAVGSVVALVTHHYRHR